MDVLPDLPIVLKKKEAGVTARIFQALLDDPRIPSCPVEIKYARGKTLYKGSVKQHQYNFLTKATSSRGIYHKMSDIAMIQQPCDGFLFKKADAYVVIYYELPDEKHEIWAIHIAKVPDGTKIPLAQARDVGLRIIL